MKGIFMMSHNPIRLFTQIDPLAEKYYHISLYAYCAVNPVKYLDPDGKDPGDFFGVLDNAAKYFGKFRVNGVTYNGIR